MHLYSYVLVFVAFYIFFIIDNWYFFLLGACGPFTSLPFFFTYKEMVTPRSQAFPPPAIPPPAIACMQYDWRRARSKEAGLNCACVSCFLYEGCGHPYMSVFGVGVYLLSEYSWRRRFQFVTELKVYPRKTQTTSHWRTNFSYYEAKALQPVSPTPFCVPSHGRVFENKRQSTATSRSASQLCEISADASHSVGGVLCLHDVASSNVSSIRWTGSGCRFS